jgi:hypothetical protein
MKEILDYHGEKRKDIVYYSCALCFVIVLEGLIVLGFLGVRLFLFV